MVETAAAAAGALEAAEAVAPAGVPIHVQGAPMECLWALGAFKCFDMQVGTRGKLVVVIQ